MHVVYDHQIFSTQEYGGISRYIVELARELDAEATARTTILAPLHMNGFLRLAPPTGVIGLYAPPIARTARVRKVVNDAMSRAWLRLRRPSLIHETYYRATSLGPTGVPSVVTVHDMIHERFADRYSASDPTSRLKAAAVQRAAAVICVSQQTRRDLLEILPVPPDKVSVVYHAYRSRPSARAEQAAETDNPYLLYVGHRRAYKNFPALLEAIAGSPALRRGCRLVCFGGGRFTDAERETIRALGLHPDAVVQREGDDDRLANLYAHAAAFVYPSLYEGFGLPVLEAMGHGCPVACSATSSLPEVGGDAVEYFDPTRPEDIAAAIGRIVESPAHAGDLRHRGTQRLALFSWSQCAGDTLRVYQRAI